MSQPERIEDEAVYVLHGQPYRETSALLEVFTRGHGRFGIVARGMRRPQSTLRALLQPFQPLCVSAAGRGMLLTLRTADAAGPAAELQGAALMAGFYMNEILIRLLHRGDAHPELFDEYAMALLELAAATPAEPVLRRFELNLLAGIGYGLTLESEAGSGTPLDPDAIYEYVLERGPVAVDSAGGSSLQFPGAELLAIARADFASAATLQAARRLLRAVLDHYLGARPLRTRQVYAAMRRQHAGVAPVLPAAGDCPDAPRMR